MKRTILANIILILILAACSAPAQNVTPEGAPSATEASSQQLAEKTTATSQENYPAPAAKVATPAADATLAPTEEIAPTAYPAPADPTPEKTVQTTFNPLPDTTRYGVAKVDAVLDALMSGQAETINGIIVYINAPCTTNDALGGPPKCQGTEADGTSVDGLPTLGAEGSFFRKSPDVLTDLPGQIELLGVYPVKADFKSEQYYPAGKHDIIVRIKNTSIIIGLRVSDDGIVRVDFLNAMPDITTSPDLDGPLTPKS